MIKIGIMVSPFIFSHFHIYVQDDLGDQSEENVEYENEPSTPYVVLEDLDNGKVSLHLCCYLFYLKKIAKNMYFLAII